MSRDYKHIKKDNNRPAAGLHNFLPFMTGLSIGLLVAFIVFLHEHQAGGNIGLDSNTQTETGAQPQQPLKKAQSLPEPTFDFYKILPNKEVNISEWIAEEQDKEKSETDETSLYIFQVGSFREYSAADQVKAKLALIGINAGIQRVVINGQDARHRVRIGPYKDPEKLKQTREQLINNGLDFMLLKLKMEDIQATSG
ncbi:MAG: SPOR domain-containing protein [Proteobacteria bacterium]|nr:SPOR domain-containing protein [Pseudomonadota bacterium]